MIDTDKYEGHTEGPWTIAWWEGTWYVDDENNGTVCELIGTAQKQDPTAKLIQDAPLLLAEIKRLRKAFEIEEQIVQAFYEYREACCFDHCEAWMLENGHRVMVKIDDDEGSEWKVEVE